MTRNARVPQTEINGVYGAAVKTFSKRMFGFVPESMGVMWHNRRVLQDMFGFSNKVNKWDACDPQLKAFAHLAVSAKVGCSFCMDFNYFMAHKEGLDTEKAREVPRWRETSIFTPLERDVMEYAEAMTQTPPAVTDEVSARLLDQLGAAALLELTMYIGLANLTARGNVALGIESEGFAEAHGLKPIATPSAAPVLV